MTGVSSGRRRPAMPHTASSILPALFSLIGLTAVIIGILAMHVWMGGYGATAHHVADTTSAPTGAHAVAVNPAVATDAVDEAPAAGSPAHSANSALAALTASDAHGDQTMPAGCGTDCSGEMALSMCVLALVLVGIAWLLTPTGRALAFSLLRRGPPLAHRTSRTVPTPSLTQLCISRT